jgi:hypothetical protein
VCAGGVQEACTTIATRAEGMVMDLVKAGATPQVAAAPSSFSQYATHHHARSWSCQLERESDAALRQLVASYRNHQSTAASYNPVAHPSRAVLARRRVEFSPCANYYSGGLRVPTRRRRQRPRWTC